MSRAVQIATAVALLAHAAHDYQSSPAWWVTVPVVVLCSLLALRPRPCCSGWRFFSSISLVYGAVVVGFLAWTFRSIETTPGLQLVEARSLLPTALAVALSASTRVSDPVSRFVHYPRALFVYALFVGSLLVSLYSIKYYQKFN